MQVSGCGNECINTEVLTRNHRSNQEDTPTPIPREPHSCLLERNQQAKFSVKEHEIKAMSLKTRIQN